MKDKCFPSRHTAALSSRGPPPGTRPRHGLLGLREEFPGADLPAKDPHRRVLGSGLPGDQETGGVAAAGLQQWVPAIRRPPGSMSGAGLLGLALWSEVTSRGHACRWPLARWRVIPGEVGVISEFSMIGPRC